MSVEVRGVGSPLQLELQVVLSCSVWVLGIKLGSSVRVIVVLNCLHLSSSVYPSPFIYPCVVFE